MCVCVNKWPIVPSPSSPHPLTPSLLTPSLLTLTGGIPSLEEEQKIRRQRKLTVRTLLSLPHLTSSPPHSAPLTMYLSLCIPPPHPLTLHPSSLPHLTSSPLTFHPSLLTPSLCIPHSLAPDPSLLIPHSSSPHSSLPHSASLTPHPLTLHPSLLTFSQSSQMEGLLTLVEEELNFSKKQSRSQIKAFVADQAKEQVCSPSSHTHTHTASHSTLLTLERQHSSSYRPSCGLTECGRSDAEVLSSKRTQGHDSA